MNIEFFFDCSSPWTYLAFEGIQPLAAAHGARIVWRPILVGGIFNAVNPGVEFFRMKERVPQRKTDYYLKDLQDWARHFDLTIRFPPAGHPINSVKVMRACLVLEPEGKLVDFARQVFRAYFAEGRMISDDGVIADLCGRIGMDPTWLLRRIGEPDVKSCLRANVDEAIARGAFGSPTIYLDGDDMYFGADRLQMVESALRRRAAAGPIDF